MFDSIFDNTPYSDTESFGDFTGVDALFEEMGMTPDPEGGFASDSSDTPVVQAMKLA